MRGERRVIVRRNDYGYNDDEVFAVVVVVVVSLQFLFRGEETRSQVNSIHGLPLESRNDSQSLFAVLFFFYCCCYEHIHEYNVVIEFFHLQNTISTWCL
jgi:hypothetical protein